MSQFFSKIMLSSVVLSSLSSAMLVEPAAAKRLNACQIKHSMCSQRCIMNKLQDDKISACIERTCDHQNVGCGGESVYDEPAGPRPRGKRG